MVIEIGCPTYLARTFSEYANEYISWTCWMSEIYCIILPEVSPSPFPRCLAGFSSSSEQEDKSRMGVFFPFLFLLLLLLLLLFVLIELILAKCSMRDWKSIMELDDAESSRKVSKSLSR